MRVIDVRRLFAALLLTFTLSCASQNSGSAARQLVPNPYFESPTGEYGYAESNPILVGSLGGSNLVENEHIYLRRLRTLDGKRVRYERQGSCCLFPSPNALYGPNAVLDAYSVFIDSTGERLTLYINMYDPGEVRPPKGFKFAE